MDSIDLAERLGRETREDDGLLCPKCAIRLQLVIKLLDSCKGKTVRMFRCECGELVWDD